MEVLNTELIQLDTSASRIDVGRRPFSVEYCFLSPSPMTPEQLEEFSIYGTKVAENGDILLSESRPENVNAKVVIPERFTAMATGLARPTVTDIELLDENTSKEEVIIFTNTLEWALNHA